MFIIPQKHKNRNPFVSELRHYLNLSPFELQTLGVWHFVLGYLRRRSLRELRCGGEKSFSATPKEKMLNTRMGIEHFWRRRKDLNLRAGYPTYTLSRGASSPLEYFSIKTARGSIDCPIIISIFFSFVNSFSLNYPQIFKIICRRRKFGVFFGDGRITTANFSLPRTQERARFPPTAETQRHRASSRPF